MKRVYIGDKDVCTESSKVFDAKTNEGWRVTGTFKHEISRALGLAWPIVLLDLRKGKERRLIKFVGKADKNIHLYSK
jgi:hypothetical protein